MRSCTACQQSKTSVIPQAQTKYHLYTGRPWQKVAIDFTGPLDTTPRSNKWILVITDHFTCWSDAIPLPDAMAATVADLWAEPGALDEAKAAFAEARESGRATGRPTI